MKKISNENIVVINATIFTVVAFMHLMRLISGTELFIGTYSVALWVSAVAVVLTAALAILNFTLIKEKTKVFWLKYLLGLVIFDGLFALYFWLNNINYLGISPGSYSLIFILDVVLVLALFYYVKKMKTLSKE